MMGWATLRHGGLPAPVLLIALALCGAPFLLPRGLFLPAAAFAVAGCAALATAGLLHPPGNPDGTRLLTGALAGAAARARDQPGDRRRRDRRDPGPAGARARRHSPPLSPQAGAHGTRAGRGTSRGARIAPRPGRSRLRPRLPSSSSRSRRPLPSRPSIELKEPAVATAPPAAAPDPDPVAAAAARGFVRDYYAALDGDRLRRRVADALARRPARVRRLRRLAQGLRAHRLQRAGRGHRHPCGHRRAPSRLTLRAGDRGACGRIAERRFAVTWRLARTPAGWRATAASARKLSGPEPC